MFQATASTSRQSQLSSLTLLSICTASSRLGILTGIFLSCGVILPGRYPKSTLTDD
uniref:Uncharacterized protein n=1 Tax=Triticum urartu TaxID=4572 RepID=A0A8R7UCF4_TRIUA